MKGNLLLILLKFSQSLIIYICAKFKVWMTIVESGWNVWVWLVGVVSRRWVWLVGVGGIYVCGYWVWFERDNYIDFLILLIPILLLYLYFFAAASLLFVHFLKCIYYTGIQEYKHFFFK